MPARNLAPDIVRQRLLIEGFYGCRAGRGGHPRVPRVGARHLGLRTYGEPVVFAPAGGEGRPGNAGLDAFVPLIDGGISGRFWSGRRFLSIVLYTCKGFDEGGAERLYPPLLRDRGRHRLARVLSRRPASR
jgi:hypothetical protein